jgi:hypothetical protein
VRDPAWLEDIAARACSHLLVAHASADLAFQHIGELVLAVVDVRVDEPARF